MSIIMIRRRITMVLITIIIIIIIIIIMSITSMIICYRCGARPNGARGQASGLQRRRLLGHRHAACSKLISSISLMSLMGSKPQVVFEKWHTDIIEVLKVLTLSRVVCKVLVKVTGHYY